MGTSPNPTLLAGMVHVAALPGTPHSRQYMLEIVRQAVAEAKLLVRAGFDAIIIENMHDRPYVHGPKGPEIVAAMTAVAGAVRDACRGQALGIQVLSGGNREALAIAHACSLEFIRCENFVFSHVADEGLLPTAEAGDLLRYRRMIGAHSVRIFADVKKKHASHAITADLSLEEAVQAAEFFGADGVVVTGTATGKPADLSDVRQARQATGLPVLVGSGVEPSQIPDLMPHADWLIVGSWIKQEGRWDQPVSLARARELVRARDNAHRAQRPAPPKRVDRPPLARPRRAN